MIGKMLSNMTDVPVLPKRWLYNVLNVWQQIKGYVLMVVLLVVVAVLLVLAHHHIVPI